MDYMEYDMDYILMHVMFNLQDTPASITVWIIY